jgi:hypothetical protein
VEALAVPPGSLTVAVRNGTGRSGLASRVAEKLSEHGYRRGKLDNVEGSGATSVHYPPGHSDAGLQVAALLGGVDAEQDPDIAPGTVEVYLASGFSVSDIRSDPYSSDSTDPSDSYGSSDSSDSSDSYGSSGSGRSRRSSRPEAPPPPDLGPPITAQGVPCVD